MIRRKRRNRKFLKYIIVGIILLLVLVLLWFWKVKHLSFNFISKDSIKTDIYEKTVFIPERPKVYSAKLIMVGDALIHNSVYNDARRLAGYNGYDFKPQIKYIKEVVKDYDLAYYNQETILGGSSLGVSSYPRFNSPYEVGDAMIDAGFNLVSLATNHTMDSGKQAILNSREYWNSQKNVQAVGSYSSNEEKAEIESKILEINNIKYAILNYTYGTNGLYVPDDYLVNVWTTENDSKYQAYKDIVASDIEKLRDKVDVLMVAMHWGVEYTHTPTSYEKDMAKFLAEHGVDIVIGTHPHVIQPVEYIGNTIVFYSLGNFISAQYQNQDSCRYYKCMVGLMSSLEIVKTEVDDKATIQIANINNDLIYTYYDSSWKNFLVIPFSNPIIKNYLSSYSNVYNYYKDIIASADERIKTVPLGA